MNTEEMKRLHMLTHLMVLMAFERAASAMYLLRCCVCFAAKRGGALVGRSLTIIGIGYKSEIRIVLRRD